MADERKFGTQELVSAKYLIGVEDTVRPGAELAIRRVRPKQSGIEQAMRFVTPVVIVMLVVAAGGLFWLKSALIAGSATQFGQHSSSGVDLLLWMSGSNKTFNQALSDRISRAQRDSAFQFDQKAAFKSEFDGVDLGNLSNAWNGPGLRQEIE